MTSNQNVNEAGWFYHAPARRRSEEAVGYPAMSQIPGLSEDDGPPEEPPRSLFRETDTKYIRLAKQGGRPNLLSIKENSSEPKPAVNYPRNDWFYLEDNAMEDESERKKNEIQYDFLRPEYMVHEAYKPDPASIYERPQRGPIAFDKLSVFEREPGNHATDKTVKLPEVKKPGYGVRSGKPPRRPRLKPQSAEENPGRGPRPLKFLPMPGSAASDKPKMNKLLGYAYEREWQNDLKSWQDKQEVGRTRHQQMTSILGQPDNLTQSEYTTSFGRPTAVHHSDVRRQDVEHSARPSEGKTNFAVRQTETQRLREARLQKPAEKEVFKMTRFKNIPARIDSQRPTVVS
ncbi:uncharacterized protein C7orf57-like [Dreissena polymorpha]|uniref:Uncharacterized protein n=1 Tax=Dreissena polymorpha TaxID=45954 RepID=A0A9D4DM50_DREPO|nr:uncharacterized protein C7orf57-like [Dreissena polymorpha]KAH3750094.1 hypothetical protein DPMN_184610 [Dreissena polymorpha]